MARLFGDKVAPTDPCPKCLFREEWELQKEKTIKGIASIITSLVPDVIVSDYESRTDKAFDEFVYQNLYWKKQDDVAIAPWLKKNPEPLLTRNEFLHHLCECVLAQEKEKGGCDE